MSDEIKYGTHIKFVHNPEEDCWWVVNKYDDVQLGTIGWFDKFHKYSFYVKPDTVYECVCLREIADFCENKTKEIEG